MIGNDGGLDVSYDQGETWEELSLAALGQFYAISADMRKPYYVCGGLQDNGSWCGPSAVRTGSRHPQHRLVPDRRRRRVLHRERSARLDDRSTPNRRMARPTATTSETGQTRSIRPPLGAAAIAGARSRGASGATPIAAAPALPRRQRGGGARRPRRRPGQRRASPAPGNGVPLLLEHAVHAVAAQSEHGLPRRRSAVPSNTRGDTWTASPDLTRNIGRNDRPIMGVAGNAPMASKHDGAASYSNIVTIGESPLVAGIVWVGTNDGNVQVSRDGGATWKNVVDNVKGVPQETHVSRVEPSHFDGGTAYVSFDNHRRDDHKPYVFVTRDFGQTWTSISSNLPDGNVNVIREDPKNRNLLYLGTEYAFYISLNGGREWKRFMTGLPTVRIDDILVHPRDNDLIVGTHGRSIWIVDDITPLQQMSEAVTTADAHLFAVAGRRRPGRPTS